MSKDDFENKKTFTANKPGLLPSDLQPENPPWNKEDIADNEFKPILQKLLELGIKHDMPFNVSIIHTVKGDTVGTMDLAFPGHAAENLAPGVFHQATDKALHNHYAAKLQFVIERTLKDQNEKLEDYLSFCNASSLKHLMRAAQDGGFNPLKKLEEFITRDGVDRHCL